MGQTDKLGTYMINSFLFDKICIEKLYAIPNSNYWDMWNSEKKDALRRSGFVPRPYGELVGEEQGTWVVALPARRDLLKILRTHEKGTENDTETPNP